MTDDQKSMATQVQTDGCQTDDDEADQSEDDLISQSEEEILSPEVTPLRSPVSPQCQRDISFDAANASREGETACELTLSPLSSSAEESCDLCPSCLQKARGTERRLSPPPTDENKEKTILEATIRIYKATEEYRERCSKTEDFERSSPGGIRQSMRNLLPGRRKSSGERKSRERHKPNQQQGKR